MCGRRYKVAEGVADCLRLFDAESLRVFDDPATVAGVRCAPAMTGTMPANDMAEDVINPSSRGNTAVAFLSPCAAMVSTSCDAESQPPKIAPTAPGLSELRSLAQHATQGLGNRLSDCFYLPLKDVGANLGVCLTTLKRICRNHGLGRWPYRRLCSLAKKLELESGKHSLHACRAFLTSPHRMPHCMYRMPACPHRLQARTACPQRVPAL